MHAVVRLNTLPLTGPEEHGEGLEQFNAAHSSQPGYVGSLVIALEPSRQLVVNLWESRALSEAALVTLRSATSQPLRPLLRQESTLLGAGPVVVADLVELTARSGPTRPAAALDPTAQGGAVDGSVDEPGEFGAPSSPPAAAPPGPRLDDARSPHAS